MDFGQCEAALMLGAVRAERVKVPEAVSRFSGPGSVSICRSS
jgi:hypothetical protein